jgi:Mg2+-importing ATPase
MMLCVRCSDRYRYGIRDQGSPLVARAQTTWFIEGATTQVTTRSFSREKQSSDMLSLGPLQLFIIHLLRTGKIPFVQSRASNFVIGLTTLIGAIAMAVPWIPQLNHALGMVPPLPEFYGFLVAILAAYALLVHIVKSTYQRLFKEWL